MVEPKSAPGRHTRHLGTLIKLLFVAGLMWFVLSQTPWRDSYEVRSLDGTVLETVHGRIVGPWDAPQVRFVPDGKDEVRLMDGITVNDKTAHVLPSLQTYWLHLDVWLFLAGALCYLLAATFAITRWWWLLKANDLPVGYWDATRFAWIGIFFSSIVPGQTGGDAIKAVYVMKRCRGDRVAALVSVIVDRVMGLGSMSLLAAVAVLFYLGEPDFRGLALPTSRPSRPSFAGAPWPTKTNQRVPPFLTCLAASPTATRISSTVASSSSRSDTRSNGTLRFFTR